MEMVDMVIITIWFSGPNSRSVNNVLQQPDFVKSNPPSCSPCVCGLVSLRDASPAKFLCRVSNGLV